MVVDRAKIERLEKELEEAKRELWREDAERYRIVIREMSEAERGRILGNLADRGERILFGLEAPEEPKRVGIERRLFQSNFAHFRNPFQTVSVGQDEA